MNLCDRCKVAEGFWLEVMTFHFALFKDGGFSIDLCKPCLKEVKAFAFGKQSKKEQP